MTPILVTLGPLILSKRADYYRDLLPGLQPAEITALEQQYDLTLPDDLKLFYQWHDGQQDDNYEAFVNNSTFVSLDNALDTAAELTSMIGTDFELPDMWHAGWIPIFSNGGGDYICYDLNGSFDGNAGQLIEYWHADDDRNIIAPNLRSFLESLVKVYEKEVDEYMQVEDLPGFPVKHLVK